MTIVLATGSSGGHFYPALELGEELRRRGERVVFIGTLASFRDVLERRGFEYEALFTQGIVGGNLARKLRSSCLMLAAFFRALTQLARHRPKVVVGFGGHGSFAVVIAAFVRGVPFMIHEQNVVPGGANKILAGLARKIAVSFEATAAYFKNSRTVLTGCPTPLRQPERSREAILSAWGLDPRKMTILVFGGSQGAHRINEIYLETIGMIGTPGLQSIHITGARDLDLVKEAYGKLRQPSAVFPYLEAMAEAYTVSDLVICRSGAMTVTELAFFRKQAILIPYPHARAHQLQNAQALAAAGLAEIIEDKDLTAGRLRERINARLQAAHPVEARPDAFVHNASQRLADAVLSLK